MTWSDFYLVCFLIGFALSVLSFLAGAVHLHVPFKLHLPFHWHHDGLRFGLKGGAHLSWFNGSSLMAFLAWFARLRPRDSRGGDIMIRPGLKVLVTGGASGIGWAIAIARSNSIGSIRPQTFPIWVALDGASDRCTVSRR